MSKKYDVITYEHTMVFNFSVSGEEEQLTRDVTLIWEDTLEKFFENHGSEKIHTIHSFDNEEEKNRFIADIEDATDQIIDEVDEEISQKMKFAHVYTSPTYED